MGKSSVTPLLNTTSLVNPSVSWNKAYVTKGDSNCMFRAISYLMTNDEENYARIRLLLQRFENLNKELFRGVLTRVNKPSVEEHVTHMGMPNTCGTHVELFATATCVHIHC